MPLKPGVPAHSRAALEAWFREQMSDPAVLAKLQADFAGTVEQLIGVRPRPALQLEIHVEQPGQTLHVQRYEGGRADSDGKPVAAPPPGHAPAPGKAPTVLIETRTKRIIVIKPPQQKPIQPTDVSKPKQQQATPPPNDDKQQKTDPPAKDRKK